MGERRLLEGVTAEAEELLPICGFLFGKVGEISAGAGADVCAETT